MTPEEAITKFQCPGCVNGSDTATCPRFKPSSGYGVRCDNHVLGTRLGFQHAVALGLPRGFNRPTLDYHDGYPAMYTHAVMDLRIFLRGDPVLHAGLWNRFNIPVWAMEGTGSDTGFLFVRTVSPRTARIFTDVIEGGTLAMVPSATDVGGFYADID